MKTKPKKKVVYTKSRIKPKEKRDRIVAFAGFNKGKKNLVPKWHIKAGDTIIVTAGKDKGKTGKVKRVLSKLGKLVIEGVNLVTKHKKPNSSQESGEIILVEKPIDISNVQIAVEFHGKMKGTRIKKNKKRERVSVLTGEVLD